MFQAIVQKAEGAVSSAVAAVVWRAAVAVPLVIAAGFGTATLAVKLSQAYGPTLASTIMAWLFVAVAGITAVIMSRKEQVAEPEAEEPGPTLAENAAEFAAPLLERDTIVPLLATAGPVALPALLRTAARNLPLLVMAVIVALFYFGRSIASDSQSVEQPKPDPAE
jgi:hypothetical protein